MSARARGFVPLPAGASLAAIAVLALTGPAPAQEGLRGYDGSNPFDCELQQAGTDTEFPDPDADPFCVEYDKTHQNVTELGLVEFLAQEPARVAAASDKCFYYQHDHWRGSVFPDDPATETYNFDGSYYFNKATGSGGVYVENFRIAGQSSDPTLLPGFPEEYKPFFGEGRGGVQGSGSVPVDPRCAAIAQADDPRADGGGTTATGPEDNGDEADTGGASESRAEDGEGPGDGDGGASDGPGFSETRREPRFTG